MTMKPGDQFLFKHPTSGRVLKATVETIVGSFVKVSLSGNSRPWITSADKLLPLPPPGDGLTDAQRKLIQAVRDGHNTYTLAAIAVSALPGQKPWKEATVASVATSLVRSGKLTESGSPCVMKMKEVQP